MIVIKQSFRNTPKMPLHVVTLNPMSSRWTRRILAGFPTRRWAYTLNIQNAIHKFKYRQGNRPAGEHPRVRLSIKDSALDANLSAYRTVNLSVICTGFMQVKALFGQCFDFFQNCGQQAFTMDIFLQGLVHRQHFLHQL